MKNFSDKEFSPGTVHQALENPDSVLTITFEVSGGVVGVRVAANKP